MRLQKPRIPLVGKNEMKEHQQMVLTLGPRRSNSNVYKTLMQHPKLLESWFVFGHYILEESKLPPRDRELVILRTGWLRQSEYEWSHHVINGRAAGLTEPEIIRITKGPTAGGWSPFETTLLQATDELYREAFISDATWNALTKEYSTEQMMDLVFTVGQYTLLSMALNSFGIQLDENTPRFPSTKEDKKS